MDFKKAFWSIIAPLLLCGFRVIPNGNLWDIDATTGASSKIFIKFPNPTVELDNDLPAGDPLYGTAKVTFQQLMNSVFDDYNNVQGSFLTLADENDPDYASNSTNRTITIEDGSAYGLTSGGYAKSSWNGTIVDGCTVVLKPEYFKSAKLFVFGATHELGHCFGLHHPMDTVNSVMSYYSSKRLRLQIDDKMGLVYLYPADKDKSKEEATLGFACSQRK